MEEAASCLLKGQLRPLGAMIRLRASPRMYPWELGGPSRGLFLTAAPQGRWASNASSALPPHLLPFPFGSLWGWEGAGGRLRRAWGVRVCSPLRPCCGPSRCTRESRAGNGVDRRTRTFVRPPPSGSSAAPEQPPWVFEQVPDGTGMSPGVPVCAHRQP